MDYDYEQLESDIANRLLSPLVERASKKDVWEYAYDVPGLKGMRGKKLWEIIRILREIELEESELSSHKVACAIARALTQQGKRLPLALQAYIVHAAEGGRRLRPSKVSRRRDVLIFAAVVQACRVSGLPRTRSAGSDAPSGCIIVSRALARIGLHMTPEAVEKIYQRTYPPRGNRGS